MAELGNFREPRRTNHSVLVLRYLPASILRAFSMMWARVAAIFADAPFLFFGVVIGVAVLFRFTVGAVRDASVPPVVAPTFVTGPEPGLASASATTEPSSGPSPSPAPSAIGEVGAAAKVQPIGAPARVAPKPRGHGRRPIRN